MVRIEIDAIQHGSSFTPYMSVHMEKLGYSITLSHIKKKTRRGALGAARRVALHEYPNATIVEVNNNAG